MLYVAFAPFAAAPRSGVAAATPPIAELVGSLPFRLLYGGVTEELLLRRGFLTLLAWPLWVAGVAFGWLFWRRSIEAARVAHATFHVALVAFSVGALVVT